MPYRRNTYDLVIDSSFSPFTLQEMMTPMLMYKDAYEKDQAVYDELNQKAGDFKYLAETLPEGSQARAIYEGYANDLQTQAQDFSQNGLSMNNRRALMSLKRRYSGEIGRLEKASTAMEEERKLRRANKDTSTLYATDNLNIDSFLDGQTPNLYSVSSDDLYKRGAQAAASASSRLYNNTEINNLTKYYQEITQRQGYNPQLLAEFRNRMEAIPELQQAVEGILQEKGVNENLTGANYERARQSVINGILDGAVYKEARSVKDNPGVLTAAQAASNALGWANHNMHKDQMNLEALMKGYKKENGEWTRVVDPNAKENPAVNYEGWEMSPDGKWHKKDPKEAEETLDGKLLDLGYKDLAHDDGFDVKIGDTRHHFSYIGAASKHGKKWHTGPIGGDNPGHSFPRAWGWGSTSNVEDAWGNFSAESVDADTWDIWPFTGPSRARERMRVLSSNEMQSLFDKDPELRDALFERLDEYMRDRGINPNGEKAKRMNVQIIQVPNETGGRGTNGYLIAAD